MFTDALDVRKIDSSDWFRFFFSWLVVVLFCCLRCHCLLVLSMNCLLYPLDWRTFVMCCRSCLSFELLVITFSARLNNAVMTLCFDLVE